MSIRSQALKTININNVEPRAFTILFGRLYPKIFNWIFNKNFQEDFFILDILIPYLNVNLLYLILLAEYLGTISSPWMWKMNENMFLYIK